MAAAEESSLLPPLPLSLMQQQGAAREGGVEEEEGQRAAEAGRGDSAAAAVGQAAATPAVPDDGWFSGCFDAEGCVYLCTNHRAARKVPTLPRPADAAAAVAATGAAAPPTTAEEAMAEEDELSGPTDACIALIVAQCDDGTITRLFRERFGGTVSGRPDAKRNGRVVWMWRLQSRAAVSAAARALLLGSRRAYTRLYLELAVSICTRRPGAGRGAVAARFQHAKALDHAHEPLWGPDDAPPTEGAKKAGDDDDDADSSRRPPAAAADVAWLAGFFDGNGSVSCCSKWKSVHLTVGQGEPHALWVLRPFQAAWGGGIYWHTPTAPHATWRRSAAWALAKQADVLAAARLLLTASQHPDRRAHLQLACRMLTVPAIPAGPLLPAAPLPDDSEPARKRRRALEHRRAGWVDLRAHKDAMRARIGKPPLSSAVA